MDWNGDGKHDWRDDALFHNVINSDNMENKPNPQKPTPNNTGRSSFFHPNSSGISRCTYSWRHPNQRLYHAYWLCMRRNSCS